jgi:hypothetical protein
VTVSLELSGPEASRPFIEAAAPEHPSLLDPTHRMGELFGVVNIPNVIWIDERGTIVRPPEPGWPGLQEYPAAFAERMAERAAKAKAEAAARAAAGEEPPKRPNLMKLVQSGQDRATYPDALRDWARNGSASSFAMTPDEVVAASQPRPPEKSESAAHFELANHLWRAGHRDAAIRHFNACHRLQPDNWTYKRQAWSLVGNESAGGGEFGRFNQVPIPGREDEWPFEGNFDHDVAQLQPGEYYPKTL